MVLPISFPPIPAYSPDLILFNGVRYSPDRPDFANVLKIDQGCLPMAADMMRNGMRVDKGRLRALQKKLEGMLGEITSAIQNLTDPYFNPGSPDQVADWLFTRYQIQDILTVPTTPTGKPSTDEDTLMLFCVRDKKSDAYNEPGQQLLRLVLDYRGVIKLLNTYVMPLQALADADSRVHTDLMVTETGTGRFAHRNPNLANIPTRDELGNMVRDCFVAGKGNRLISSDLSQIEMRWPAHLSQDSAMMQVFHDGLDIHTATTLRMFFPEEEFAPAYAKWMALIARDDGAGVPLDVMEKALLKEFKRNYRAPAKNLGFGILYGLTPPGLQNNILVEGGPLIPIERCEVLIEAWFAAYPNIREWMKEQYYRARRFGMVWSAFGRPRQIHGAHSALKWIVSKSLREAGNQPVQCSAGETLKLAMAAIQTTIVHPLRQRQIVCLPLVPVHDELIFEVAERHADEVGARVQDAMQRATPLTVPVKAGLSQGESWGELK